MRFTKLPSRLAQEITERRGYARSTTPITMAPSLSIPMGTTSRRSAIILSEKTMTEPDATPPFERHRIYYLILKIAVIIAAVLLALRLVDII